MSRFRFTHHVAQRAIRCAPFALLTIVGALSALAAAETPSAGEPEGVAGYVAALVRGLLKGGWPVFLQLGLSIVAGAYVIERFRHLRRAAIAPPGLAEQADALWRAGKHRELLALADRHPCALARVLRFVVLHRDNDFADIGRAVDDLAGRTVRHHVQRAYPLAVIGMLEPLLGLLGTVLGMMATFDAVAKTGALGDATVLAHGISQFLICTGTGLFIAVPCISFYHVFKLRAAALAHELEEQVDALLHGWFLNRNRDDEAAAATVGASSLVVGAQLAGGAA